MGLVASGTYIINDLTDLEADRLHPTKRERPLARGDIPAQSAFAVAVLMIGAGLAGAAMLQMKFALAMLLYLALTLAYSLYLKRAAMLDVFVLGGLYAARILMGSLLIASPLSPWLIVFSLFLFLSLSMAKRHVEIVKTAAAGGDDKVRGRGYLTSDAPLTLGFGIASSVAAVLLILLYVVHDAYPAGAYKSPVWLWPISFIVFLWTARLWLLSHRGELDDDPVVFALKDPASLFLGVLVLGCFVGAIL